MTDQPKIKKSDLTIVFQYRRKGIGFVSWSPFFDLSIHKGITGWGLTRNMATNRLVKNWNKRTSTSGTKKEETIDTGNGLYKVIRFTGLLVPIETKSQI